MKQLLILTIPATASLKHYSRQIQSDINRFGLPVTWVKPDDLSLVINNLGRLNREQIPPLSKAIAGVVQSFTPFSLTLDFVQTQYLRHKPSLIYLSPAKNSHLTDLHHNLSDQLNLLAIPQPVRFLPQIVLGTLKRADPTTTKHFLDKIQDFELVQPIDLAVTCLHLLEVFTTKKSTHYQRVGTFAMSQSLHDSPSVIPQALSTSGILPAGYTEDTQ